uniref:Uncharacterized protein n=1 Tax=Arundo donax TaxID=35708 RepID=A0A0A9BKC8_ARUDO
MECIFFFAAVWAYRLHKLLQSSAIFFLL